MLAICHTASRQAVLIECFADVIVGGLDLPVALGLIHIRKLSKQAMHHDAPHQTRGAARCMCMQVLSHMLHQHELETVFGNVARLYSRAVSDAFLQLPPQVCSVRKCNAMSGKER